MCLRGSGDHRRAGLEPAIQPLGALYQLSYKRHLCRNERRTKQNVTNRCGLAGLEPAPSLPRKHTMTCFVEMSGIEPESRTYHSTCLF